MSPRWFVSPHCARVRSQAEMRPVQAAEKGVVMTRYPISFDDGAMTFPEEDLPAVAEAAHAVAQEAMDAGVWVFGGGLHSHECLLSRKPQTGRRSTAMK
jgi:hypothetical protein